MWVIILDELKQNIEDIIKDKCSYWTNRFKISQYKEDIQQDVRIKLLINKNIIHEKSFISTIVRNLCIDYQRKMLRNPQIDEDAPELSYDIEESILSQIDIEEQIKTLSEEDITKLQNYLNDPCSSKNRSAFYRLRKGFTLYVQI